MNTTRKIGVALAAAAVAAGTGVAAVDAAAAATSHTLHITAVQLKSTQTKSGFLQAEKDVEKGKVTGYDAISCKFNFKINKAVCDGGLSRTGGMLYVHAVVGQTGHGKGTVTGGTRAYKGATGTIAIAPGAAQNQTKLTITYSN